MALVSETFNALGASAYAGHLAVMPEAIPGVPTDIEVEAVSGSQLEVFFSPPTSPSGDITQYTVQCLRLHLPRKHQEFRLR